MNWFDAPPDISSDFEARRGKFYLSRRRISCWRVSTEYFENCHYFM